PISQNVKEYLGVPRFRYDTVDKYPQIGVVTGLAWTEVGGEVLTIEAQTMEGKGKLILTGQLGDVMKESAQTGWTYLRSIGKEIGIPANVEENTDLHIHVPEGAIPKDGPSAGISMATALASIFSKRKVRQDVAMTGEITLRGRVLPIGGVKEKVLAAHRGGAKVIILPADNKKDLEDIPSNVKRKLEFHLVENLREVLEIALLPAANKKKVSASKPAKQD
ncbi:MAG: magnesium chelatase domain-containing protein, partial [Clostridia bacterium]|nr:magnesium chelatase domain-containing protein [Clostridia bacterium]